MGGIKIDLSPDRLILIVMDRIDFASVRVAGSGIENSPVGRIPRRLRLFQGHVIAPKVAEIAGIFVAALVKPGMGHDGGGQYELIVGDLVFDVEKGVEYVADAGNVFPAAIVIFGTADAGNASGRFNGKRPGNRYLNHGTNLVIEMLDIGIIVDQFF